MSGSVKELELTDSFTLNTDLLTYKTVFMSVWRESGRIRQLVFEPMYIDEEDRKVNDGDPPVTYQGFQNYYTEQEEEVVWSVGQKYSPEKLRIGKEIVDKNIYVDKVSMHPSYDGVEVYKLRVSDPASLVGVEIVADTVIVF